MTISEDLRIRIVRKIEAGLSRHKAAALFEVSVSSAVRFAKQFEEEGTVAIRPRAPRQRRLDPYGTDIHHWIEQKPDMTLEEISARLFEQHGLTAATSTVDDWLRANGLTFKKNSARQ